MTTIETIQADYTQADVCMSELLASTPADALTLEKALSYMSRRGNGLMEIDFSWIVVAIWRSCKPLKQK